ncbi:MAG: heme-copper oxidase subunit III [Bacteroidia bacterium]|nr:heme-copper oxidase subunit III [Bacteroidia bacterium]MCZ2249472.1 heme-copper oxidase subunit III [Bacteroidia bacterium]
MENLSQSNDLRYNKALKERSAKFLLFLAIASIIMAFAGLTSAYVVTKGSKPDIYFDLPFTFYYSTAIILISSLTINMSLVAVRKNNYNQISLWLIITFILGLAFTYVQYKAWGELYQNKVYFAGKQSNPLGSFLYIITGLHVAHLFGGLIYLIGVIVRSFLKQFNSENYLKLKLSAIYWHFLDILWIYLFLFLLFYR